MFKDLLGNRPKKSKKKLEATVGQKNGWTDEDATSLEQNKKSLGWNVTHTKM